MFYAMNMSTDEIKLFEDKGVEFEKFARRAILDYCSDCFDGGKITTGLMGKTVSIDEDSCEIDFWQFCAILFCKCKSSNNWEGIIGITEIVNEEEEE